MGSVVVVVLPPLEEALGASLPSSVFHFSPGSFLRRVSSTFAGDIRVVEAAVSMAAKSGSIV